MIQSAWTNQPTVRTGISNPGFMDPSLAITPPADSGLTNFLSTEGGAAIGSAGIGVVGSLAGAGINAWMSLYAMREQRKEARKTRALQMKIYEGQKQMAGEQFSQEMAFKEKAFQAEDKWARIDRKRKAMEAFRNAMLAQPGLNQQLFNYNKMYRRK